MIDQDLALKVNELHIERFGPASLRLFHQGGESVKPIQKKEDSSESHAYTPADVEMEELIKSEISILRPEYGFIGEETVYKTGKERIEPLNGCKRSFVVDPIDGTWSFRKKLEDWAISIGIIEEDNKIIDPKMGLVYLPCQDILYFTGKTHSLERINASSPNLETFQLKPPIFNKEHLATKRIAVYAKEQVKEHLTGGLCHEFVGSSVCQSIGVIKGDYLGTITNAYIWDIAATHAIGSRLGINFYNLQTKEKVDKFKRSDFEGKNSVKAWKLKKSHLICHESAADSLLSKMR